MNRLVALPLAAALVATPASLCAQEPALAGAWVVDLSVKKEEPYTKPMRLDLRDDGTVGGFFYQAEIDAGRWKTDRGRTCVSFRTHDDNTPYHSSVCIVGDHAEGQTWAENRNFLFNWNAVRAPSEK